MVGMLANQVALIYGAAGGIGRAVAERYWAEGASVVAVDRNAEALRLLADACDPAPEQRLGTLVADGASWTECVRVTEAALDIFGRIDVLVSCIGIYDHAISLAEVDGDKLEAAFDECFRVNVGSMLFAAKAALPALIKSKGRIVLTSSVASYLTAGGGVLYTASKHAVSGIIAQLAHELAPHVRVNGVAPGVARTIMSGLRALGQVPQPSLLPGSEQALPLERIPETSEYGGIYALLGSATESSVMTGTIVVADSGLLIAGVNRGAPP